VAKQFLATLDEALAAYRPSMRVKRNVQRALSPGLESRLEFLGPMRRTRNRSDVRGRTLVHTCDSRHDSALCVNEGRAHGDCWPRALARGQLTGRTVHMCRNGASVGRAIRQHVDADRLLTDRGVRSCHHDQLWTAGTRMGVRPRRCRRASRSRLRSTVQRRGERSPAPRSFRSVFELDLRGVQSHTVRGQ
jgi:hypothetical protein